MNLPETARRLFAHVDVVAGDDSGEGLVVGRILEEGESGDLRWLIGEVGEERLTRWVGERGRRQLSRRSRWFWESVLGVAAAESPAVAEELWPL